MFPLDYYVISDTGSDDNTADIIKQFFDEKRYSRQKFTTMNGLALPITETVLYNMHKEKTDYVLIFDADDRFEGILYYLKN